MLKYAVSEMEAPPAHFDGTVDSKQFWDSVTSEIVCSGLLTCKYATYLLMSLYLKYCACLFPTRLQ